MLLEELLDGGIGGALLFPLAFPDGLDEVPVLVEQTMFFLTGLEHIVHGLAQVARMWLVPLEEAGGAAMPEAAVELVHGVGARSYPSTV